MTQSQPASATLPIPGSPVRGRFPGSRAGRSASTAIADTGAPGADSGRAAADEGEIGVAAARRPAVVTIDVHRACLQILWQLAADTIDCPACARTLSQHAVDTFDICPDCLRTSWQHSGLSCEELDDVEANVAHAQLPFWRRLRTRAPRGWRVRTPRPQGGRS